MEVIERMCTLEDLIREGMGKISIADALKVYFLELLIIQSSLLTIPGEKEE